MKYIKEQWKITHHSYRPRGMSVPEPITWVRFEYLLGKIVIEYGEYKASYKNKDFIITLIGLL